MLTLLEQLDKGSLWQSPGGIHPPELKHLSNQTPIAQAPLFKRYVVPVPQVGDQARLLVSVGDAVLKGQMLTEGQGFGYLPVHAPTSGIIKAIKPISSNHASGLPVDSCVIESDGQDKWCELTPVDLTTATNSQIIAAIKNAGIAGMGGATFPTHIKLNTASEIDLVIINGVECEPYITSDDRLMQEHALEILQGVEVIHQLLSPKRIIIAVEDNKPEAAESLRLAISQSKLPPQTARVTVIPTKYPSGGEKQLIQILTGKEVPSGSLPSQLGIVVQNVGTAFAIQQAIHLGKPLIERVVTLTGNNIQRRGNYWLPIGSVIADVLENFDFKAEQDQKVIIGGPMMGYAIPNTQSPILKGTNCILTPSSKEMAADMPEKACIRCGECAIACPALLLPQQLFWHAKAEEYDKAASFNLQDCIECGCCSYVCPSDIPLVEYYRIAKSALRIEAEEKVQAEQAKLRFEARLQRLEDEKLAREAKAKEAAAKRQANMKSSDKDAVAAAMARIAAKKAATASPAENSSNKPASDKNSAVNAAIERAKAKKLAKAQTSESQTSSDALNNVTAEASSQSESQSESKSELTPQQQRVAAAVARAKAKKQQLAMQNSTECNSSSGTDSTNESPSSDSAEVDKKAKVAAAVARAKAKKLAAQKQVDVPVQVSADTGSATTSAEISTEAQPQTEKQQKVAAAIAKAKAKKVAQQAENTSSEVSNAIPNTSDEPVNTAGKDGLDVSAEENKKARIAAAVAKAKAKKQAQQTTAPVPPDALLNNVQVLADDLSASQEGHIDLALSEPISPEEQQAADKKAKIAAAIAKAKAKKAQQQNNKD
ncbi:electron transport complex subunit RsxC [Shewanella gaetbuli]